MNFETLNTAKLAVLPDVTGRTRGWPTSERTRYIVTIQDPADEFYPAYRSVIVTAERDSDVVNVIRHDYAEGVVIIDFEEVVQ